MAKRKESQQEVAAPTARAGGGFAPGIEIKEVEPEEIGCKLFTAEEARIMAASPVSDMRAMVKKPDPVWMTPIYEEFAVATNEGVLKAYSGDWLAFDPVSGHAWPVQQAYVVAHYVTPDVLAPTEFAVRMRCDLEEVKGTGKGIALKLVPKTRRFAADLMDLAGHEVWIGLSDTQMVLTERPEAPAVNEEQTTVEEVLEEEETAAVIVDANGEVVEYPVMRVFLRGEVYDIPYGPLTLATNLIAAAFAVAEDGPEPEGCLLMVEGSPDALNPRDKVNQWWTGSTFEVILPDAPMEAEPMPVLEEALEEEEEDDDDIPDLGAA